MAMSKIIITQTRSQIKCPQRQKATLKALGLGRIVLGAPDALVGLDLERPGDIELGLEQVAIGRGDRQRRDFRHGLPGLHRVTLAQRDAQQPPRHRRGDAVAIFSRPP